MPIEITRARALIIHQKCVLLMKRIKPDMVYYTLLGGKVEPGETPEQACVREVMEECGVTVKLGREIHRAFDVFNDIPNTHIIYLCHYQNGTPTLGGEEQLRSTAENYYEPLWVPIDQLSDLVIKPEWQAPFILSAIKEHGQ